MNHRMGNSAVLALVFLLLCGPVLAGWTTDKADQCLDYSTYMHVVANVPTEARHLDRMGDLVYVSSLQVIDVSMPGAPAIVGSFAGQDGDVRGITATATHLYMIYSAGDGQGFNGMAVYDLANPVAPALISTLVMPQFMTQMRISGDRAYLRNDQSQLLIVDISNPAAPVAQGLTGGGWLDSFDLNGMTLYAVDSIRDDVVILDVTDANNMQVVGRMAMSGVIAISFHGDYGYFVDAVGTKVLHFTGPDTYTVVNDLAGMTRPLVVHGDMGYNYGNPMQVYSLADPANPARIVTVPFVVYAGLLDGDRALLGISNTFAEMDLSNTDDLPGVVAIVDVNSTVSTMIDAGGHLVTLSRDGIETFDTSSCQAPNLVGSLMWQERVAGQAIVGDYLFVLVSGSSFGRQILKVYDLSDMSAPTEVAAKNLNGDMAGLTAVGQYLYAGEHGALILIDISDPLAPTMFSRTDGVGFSDVTAVNGNDLVVADGTMLRHFDVTSDGNPLLTTSVDAGVEGTEILLSGGMAYFGHRGGAKIYAVSSFGAKNLMSEVTVPGGVNSLAIDGSTLYVEGSGIFMFDVTDAMAPIFVGNLGYVADRVTNLMVVSDCLYFDQYVSPDRGRINIAVRHCAEGDPGETEVVIDIKPGSDTNPINCRSLHGVIPVAILTTADFDALSVDHNTVRFGPGEAAETHRNGGRGRGRGHHGEHEDGELKRHEEDVDGDGDIDLVFHFAREEALIACGDTEGWLTGETFDGESFTAWDVVRTVPGDHDDDGDDDGDDDADKGLHGPATMTLGPNPFNPMTTIAFNLPATERMRVEVYDLTGRRIAVVANEVFHAGENRVVWRGVDNGGRAVASGVYFVRVTGPGVELRQRAVLLK